MYAPNHPNNVVSCPKKALFIVNKAQKKLSVIESEDKPDEKPEGT